MTEQADETTKAIKTRNYFKLFLKILLYPILGILALNVVLYLLLSIPYIQTKAVKYAIEKVQPIVNTKVSIDKVQLKLFYHLHIEGVYVEDQQKDTLLYTNSLDTQFNLWGLLRNELVISNVELDDFVGKVSQKTPQSDFNFQFLIDALASDSTKPPSTNPITVRIGNIMLKNGRLNYDVLSAKQTHSFNASHIALRDVNTDIVLGTIDIKDLHAAINHLSFKEQSDLVIQDLRAEISSNDSLIWTTKLELDLSKSKLNFEEASFNLETNVFKLRSDNSSISPKDLIPFVPNMKFLKNDFTIQTTVDGALPRINVSRLKIRYGNDLAIEGKGFMSDCSHYATSDLAIQISKFKVSPQGIRDIASLGDPTFVAPPIIKMLGDIRFSAKLKGKLKKLNLTGDVWVDDGAINVASSIATDSTFQNLDIQAKLYTQNFDLSRLTNNKGLKRLSMDIDLVANKNDKQAFSTKVNGRIESLGYKESTVKDALLSAHYDPKNMGATLKASLPVGKLDAQIDLKVEKSKEYNFNISLANLKVNHFYQNRNWKNPLLDFHLVGTLSGLETGDIHGNAVLDSLHFRGDNFEFRPGKITLSAIEETGTSSINFNSSLLKLKLAGEYHFVQLSSELSNLLHAYLPSVFPKKAELTTNRNRFEFEASLVNTENVSTIFNLPVSVIEPMEVRGRMNTIDNKIALNMTIPYIKYGTLPIKGTVIEFSNDPGSTFTLDTKSQFVQKFGTLGCNLKMKAQGDSLQTNLTFATTDSNKVQNINMDGVMDLLTHFSLSETKSLKMNMNIHPTRIRVGNLKLDLLPATIKYENARTTISNLGITLDKEPYFSINGTISNAATDTLTAYFNEAQLSNLLKPFDVDHMSAIADGKVKLISLMDHPQVYTHNLKLNDIIIFNDTLGTLKVNSSWDHKRNAVTLDAELSNGKTTNTIKGLVYPTKDSLNMGVKLDRLSLAWVQPFESDLLNKLSGSISANLTVNGEISSPSVDGWLGANQLSVGIDYTNVTYTISDTIKTTPGKIGFDNLIIKDDTGNKATVNANITHDHFDDFKYEFNLKLDNLMVLNTINRTDSLFYGKVFASGGVNIEGDKDDIDIKIKVKNEKNSSLNILIPQTSEASDYKSVVYINTPKKDSTVKVIDTPTQKILPLKLAVNLDITPEIGLNVVINPLTGDAMQIKGAGSIDLDYDMGSNSMKTFGDYTLKGGGVKLKLQQLPTIEFQIKEGSKLHFIGDPLRTSFDITAYHRVKADLTTLDPSFALDGMSSTKVFVDCVLGIKGNMQKLDLSYDISLPDASDEVQQKLKSLINTDEQKLKQFAYLIASGTFYSNNSSNTNLTTGLWTNIATSTLSSGLDAVLGNVLGDKWQIGTNIESNDGTFSNMDMSVSVSTKLLNDKLKLNTNVGYRTDQSNSSENSFIGDFDAEYELTRTIKLKAYNKTNDNIYDQSPTTQGIGIVYTKEAKTLRELFNFFGKSKKKDKKGEKK